MPEWVLSLLPLGYHLLTSFIDRLIHSQSVSGSSPISPSPELNSSSNFAFSISFSPLSPCTFTFRRISSFLFRCCLYRHYNVHGWFYLKRVIQYLHWYFFIILDGFYVSGSQLINMSLTDKLCSLNYVDNSPYSSSYNTILPKTFSIPIVPKEDFIPFFIRFIGLYFRIVLLSIWQQPVEYWAYFPCLHDLGRR